MSCSRLTRPPCPARPSPSWTTSPTRFGRRPTRPRRRSSVDWGNLDYAGGHFTQFKVIDPASRVTYRAVRVGLPRPDWVNDYVDPGWATFRTEVNTANRGFFYVPAPLPG